jgi:hypothetical protein
MEKALQYDVDAVIPGYRGHVGRIGELKKPAPKGGPF